MEMDKRFCMFFLHECMYMLAGNSIKYFYRHEFQESCINIELNCETETTLCPFRICMDDYYFSTILF